MSLLIYDDKTFDLRSKKSEYNKVNILNMPKMGLNNPPMGPAIIQAITKEMGSTVNFYDLNLEYFNFLNNSEHKNILLNHWPESGTPLEPKHLEELKKFFQYIDLSTILNCDILAISNFSVHSHRFTEYFLQIIRPLTSAIIVMGGPGTAAAFSIELGKLKFGEMLKEKKLIDHYVLGEGELSWRALLSNTLPYPGIDSESVPLDDFTHVPTPDYNNFKLNEYLNSKIQGLTVGVEGSRGCVRNCTFCDVRSFWKKYKFKDGIKLANELINLKKQYGVKHFFFNDSLINGSDKAFRQFIQTLASYNRQNKTDPINWSAYYIIKEKQTYKDTDWNNLKDSGVKSLYIGIESGSESVRDHMKKKFSNTDIEYVMNNLQRYGIKCTWLLIIGYPTETDDDFEQTLTLLRKYQSMAIDGTIDTVALGLTLGIIEESPLNDLKDELQIESLVGGFNNDIYWKNKNSDFKIRLKRRILAEELIRELGYNSWVGDMDQVKYFETKLLEIENGIVDIKDISSHHG